MSRVENNYELNALSQCANLPLQYFAVTSEFTPPAGDWKFWNVFCGFGQRAAAADNLIFRNANGNPCKNDLVVDTLLMTEYLLPPKPPVPNATDCIHQTRRISEDEAFSTGSTDAAEGCGANPSLVAVESKSGSNPQPLPTGFRDLRHEALAQQELVLVFLIVLAKYIGSAALLQFAPSY